MSEGCITIERIANGYTVSFRDEKLAAKNRKSTTYVDPYRKHAFNDMAEVIAFLKKNENDLLPPDDYDSAFTRASEEADAKRK
jgi:hypothetical protein